VCLEIVYPLNTETFISHGDKQEKEGRVLSAYWKNHNLECFIGSLNSSIYAPERPEKL